MWKESSLHKKSVISSKSRTIEITFDIQATQKPIIMHVVIELFITELGFTWII